MSNNPTHIVPKKGLAGLVQNWQSDLIAAISVALVALPLGLGIAIASGVPPMSGVISAIIGGVVTTLYRGSYIGINGPTAGLIAVILASAISLDDGSGRALNYVFAAFVVSGGLQVLLGLLKLGRFADLFHSTVIQGILAAIGIIIFAKQIHVALGTEPSSANIITTLREAVEMLPDANPFVAVISVIGLILLIFHSKINYSLFHFIPAPIWVLALSLPVVYFFGFTQLHDIHFLGRDYAVGPHLLIDIPDKIIDAIGHPDFSCIDTMPFWISVISITLIASIESLASSKAVDKLDPYKRKTNLNKDLIGIGLSTMVSGMIGGLPVISVIVRSTVNVNNHAKTKWSNFYHGLLLLAFVFLLAPIIQMVPLAALASILVYIGFKLASPKVFRHVYSQGIEQLIIFVGTIVITLYSNLLVGIFGGLLLALTIHYLMAKIPTAEFFRSIFNPGSTVMMHKNESWEIRLKGIANFLGGMKIEELLNEIPRGAPLTIDLTSTRLVDFSVMEHLYEFKRKHELTGGEVDILGLEDHISSSPDKQAMKVRIDRHRTATARQLGLMEMALEHDWDIDLTSDEQVRHFRDFYFFQSRTINRRYNRITSLIEGITWEVCDINFEEGALLAADQYRTTIGLIHSPHPLPKFTIEKTTFLNKYLDRHKDIDYVLYDDLSDDFIVKVDNEESMANFLNPEIRDLIETSNLHHLESDGKGILVFSDGLKLARLGEYTEMVHLLDGLRTLLRKT